MSDYSVILVDGSSYLFRAFHALPPLTNSSGMPTGAAYGVINMLKKLIAEYQPEYLGVVFDAPGKTFRDDMYPEYKSNRPPMPDDLRVQIQPLHDMVRALGYPLIVESGVEADDVIGTLAQRAADEGKAVLISTGDKDLAQLVNDKVTLINTMNNKLMDFDGVVEKFGVRPDQIIDWLALVGDSVDNIPGVPKCGPKTATKWLDTHQTMRGVMDVAPEMKGKIGEYLRGALEQLPLSYDLATIKMDVPLDHVLPSGIADLKPVAPDNDALVELFGEMEFRTWLREALGGSASGDASGGGGFQLSASPSAEPVKTKQTADLVASKGEYSTVLEKQEFLAWVEQLKAAELFAFDTETTSLNYMQARVVGVSFAVEVGKAAYVPFAHDYEGAPEQLSREFVLDTLKPLLEDDKAAKVGQHLKYDAHVLRNEGITLRGIKHDTMLQSYVLNSAGTRHDMDSLALKYLGKPTIKFEEVAGKGKAQKTFNQIDLEQAGPYAAEDADITLQLHQHLWPQLEADEKLKAVYQEIEIPLVPVLGVIEETGVKLDPQRLADQSHEFGERLAELEAQAHELAGAPFNLSSPKQLQVILFEQMGLPVKKKTPKGQPSTAEEVLVSLAEEYELPKVIMEHRGLYKLKSTYTDKLPLQIDPTSKRVHTSYHQAVAATGRLSSSDPNLQNIPIRSAEGRRIRQAFIAPEGYKIVAADYSQIELRIMAHISKDEGLLKAFENGLDVHRATAAEVFGVEFDAVETEQRRAAKAINFGLIYGMSAFGLAKQLNISRSEASEYIDLYFGRYPGVREYMDNTREEARKQGYVETIYGRRLYLPEINARNANLRQYAERTAINAPMQGSAADIIKRAMLAVHDWQLSTSLDVRVIMQVHDELVFEVAESEVDAAVAEIKQLMTGASDLCVPLEVEVGIGDNWDEAH
ncbi:MAG: DNA polymerase-1 [Gammaproteobacteria bacterium]|jgi:DNA polymerase-1